MGMASWIFWILFFAVVYYVWKNKGKNKYVDAALNHKFQKIKSRSLEQHLSGRSDAEQSLYRREQIKAQARRDVWRRR